MDSISNEQTLSQSGLVRKIESLLTGKPIILQLLRFAAIGFLNTALNFIVANLISKYLGVEQGSGLGLISGIGFILAVIQSYYWNKDWAFGAQAESLFKNFLHLVWVGVTGVLALAGVLLGSKAAAPYYFYFIVLLVFLLAQYALWRSFGLSSKSPSVAKNPFISFFIVSLIGFLINFGIVAEFSKVVHLTASADLNKNISFIAATVISLVWNFVGYKLLVFKK